MTPRGKRAWAGAVAIVASVTPLLLPDGIPLSLGLVFYGVAALLALYAGVGWLLTKRKSKVKWPGFGAYLVVSVGEGQNEQRRYIFDQYKDDGAAVELYISASDVFTLGVTDVNGENYSLEARIGRKGLPLAQWLFLEAEVAILEKSTKLALSVNGKEIQRRILPFRINLGDDHWGKKGTIGSDRTGSRNGKFKLGTTIIRSPTLSEVERRKLLTYIEDKWKVLD